MYAFLNRLKKIISEKTEISEEDSKAHLKRCDYFKAAVGNVMKYFVEQSLVYQIEEDPGSLEGCTEEFFSNFIQYLKNTYNVDLFFLL